MTRQYGKGRVFRQPKSPRYYIAYMGPTEEVREVAGDTEQEARQLLEKRLREVANHREGLKKFTAPVQRRITVNELLDDVVKDHEIKGRKSVRTTKYHMNPVRLHLGSTRAASVTAKTIERYISARQAEGVANTTIDRELEFIRRAFRLGVSSGLVGFVPEVPQLVARHANARSGFFGHEAFFAVLKQIPSPDFRDFLEWLFFTGMRPGEINSLTWESYDRETRTLRLRTSDTKANTRPRVIPITGPLEPVFARRIEARRLDVPTIFHANSCRLVRQVGGLYNRFYRQWRAACAAVGIQGAIPYDLRRTAIRNLRDAGVPERVAMEISGHTSRATFDRYGIVDERDISEAFESLIRRKIRINEDMKT